MARPEKAALHERMAIQKWGQAALAALLIATFMALGGPYRSLSSLIRVAGQPQKIPPIIALTFDDGPSPEFTPKILALLTRYHAHATFFVLGTEVAHFPNIVRDIVKQGSVVANHGYQHLNYFQVGVAGMLHDAAQAEALLKKEKIPTVPFYRPPFGNSNNKLVEALAKHGYTVTLWSIDTRDWSMPGITYITRKVLQDAKPGSIVLMHDSGGNRQQTISALEAILPALSAEGYRFVTLPRYVKDLGLTAPAKLPLPESGPNPTKKTANP